MNIRKRLFIAFLLLILPLGVLAQPINVKSYHPRVLIDSSTIDLLQARALANTPEWQELQLRISVVDAYSSEEIMGTVYEGQHYAFMYALSFYASGNTAHRDSAVSLFQEFFNGYTEDSTMYYDSGYESRSTMVEVSLLYDWLYNYLPEPFRSNVRARLILWADWILTQPGIYGIWYGPYYDPGNNYTMGHFTGITHVGFAIHSEDPLNGNKFIQKADSIRPFLMDFANTRLSGGDANEGWGYGAGYAVNYFKALAVFKTATVDGIDHFSNTTYDEDVMKFLPMATLPDLEHMLPEGDWARESTGELWDFNRIGADLVSSYSNDPVTRQVAIFWGEETVPFSNFAVSAYRWYPFLFSNQEETPLDYRTQPFYQGNYIYTDTIGTDQFIRRTGWDSDDLWVSYRAGGRYGDHAHNGSGHFSVYKDGWLLIDNNILTSSGIEGYDSMHNCIHVEHMNSFEMYPFNDYANAERSLGVRRDFTNEYSYLWTNSAPIYLNRSSVFNNVEVNQRQFFFLPEINKLAIYDLVETTNATDQKWFGLNYLSAPTLAPDSSYSYLSNATSRATVHTAYPMNSNVLKYGNSVRVRNHTLQPEDHFMHLVSVTPVSAGPLVMVPMNNENGRVVESCFYGSYHKDVVKDYVILFASEDNTCSYDSMVYDVPLTNEIIHNYLIGLEPLTDYYVSSSLVAGSIRLFVSINNHTGAVQHTSTSGGILSFELTDYAGIDESTLAASPLNIYYQSGLKQVVIESYLQSLTDTQIEVYAISGQRLAADLFSGETNRIEMPIADFAPGVYIISISSNEIKKGTYKLVIN